MADQQIRLSDENRAWLHLHAQDHHDGDLSAALDHLITAARLAEDRHYQATQRTGQRGDPWSGITTELDEHNRHR